MKLALFVACAFVGLVPIPPIATAQPPNGGDPEAIERLVARCRATALIAYHGQDTGPLDAYVSELRADQRGNRDRIIACGAYLVGVGDGAAGLYRLDLAEDPD